MNSIAKFLFTATAFAPAMFVYGAVWAMDGCFMEAAASVLVGALLVGLCWALIGVAVRRLGEMTFLPTKVETADNEVMSFVLLYVLPLVTKDLATYNWWAWTLIAVFLCWIVARSYAYQFNPMLALLGWHFYKVSDDNGVSYALMTKREFHKAETPMVVGILTTYTLVEKP